MSGGRRWRRRHGLPALHRMATVVAMVAAATAVLFALTFGYAVVGGAARAGLTPAGPVGDGPVPDGERGTGLSPPSDRAIAEPVRPPVSATPEAMMELLTRLLPPGQLSGHAKHAGRNLEVEVQFESGTAIGLIRVVLTPNLTPEERADRACTEKIREIECDILPDGTVTQIILGNGCLQQHMAEADHRDGTRVRVEVANCLVDDGANGPNPPRRRKEDLQRNPPPPTPLDLSQSQTIVVDHRWGWQMDAELIEAGRQKFPRLATIRDPDRPVIQRKTG